MPLSLAGYTTYYPWPLGCHANKEYDVHQIIPGQDPLNSKWTPNLCFILIRDLNGK